MLFPDWRGDLLVPALQERDVRHVLRDERPIVGQQPLVGEANQRTQDVKVVPDGFHLRLTDGDQCQAAAPDTVLAMTDGRAHSCQFN